MIIRLWSTVPTSHSYQEFDSDNNQELQEALRKIKAINYHSRNYSYSVEIRDGTTEDNAAIRNVIDATKMNEHICELKLVDTEYEQVLNQVEIQDFAGSKYERSYYIGFGPDSVRHNEVTISDPYQAYSQGQQIKADRPRALVFSNGGNLTNSVLNNKNLASLVLSFDNGKQTSEIHDKLVNEDQTKRAISMSMQ